MFRVVTENIELLFNHLKNPTKSPYNEKGGVSPERLGRASLTLPLKDIDISVLSTGELIMLKAVITSMKLTYWNFEKEKETTGKIPITFDPSMQIPGTNIISINPREVVIEKNGVEKFRIYAHKLFDLENGGSPVVISAGIANDPSGPVIKLESIEQLQEDLEIFGKAIEQTINPLYTMLYKSALITKQSINTEGKTREEVNEEILEKTRSVEFYANILKEDHTVYLRTSLSNAITPYDGDDEDEDENYNEPSDNRPQVAHIGKVHELIKPENIKETLDDVAGIENQKEQIIEILEFIENPERFTKLGAEIPKGILLHGPPGTGKTMIAKGIAKEAGIPFFFISGSGFLEIFVGTGAGRVRELFKDAKRNSPCIIFVDEIDAIGRRGDGNNSERDQACNEFLIQMEGFNDDPNVIVIVATNRVDMLDNALLSRFGRQIALPNPDIEARKKILTVHTRNKPLEDSVNLKHVARATNGFSGRDLRNLANEAAILAGRKYKDIISHDEFEEARKIIIMGSERRIKNMKESDRKITAIHEAGHALLFEIHPEIDSVTNVTIVPRDKTLGLTWHLPDEDSYHVTKHELLLGIQAVLGGRAAEINIYGEKYITTGASSDIKEITKVLKDMVMKYGMSKVMGSIYYGGENFHKNLGYFLGNDISSSQETLREIDKEIKDLADKMLEKACEKLKRYGNALHAIANALLEKETLTGDEVRNIIIELYPDLEDKIRPTHESDKEDTWKDIAVDTSNFKFK